MVGKIRIGALISGGGTNLQAIIGACDDGKIEGCIALPDRTDPEAGWWPAKGPRKKHSAFSVDYKSIIRENQRSTCKSNYAG